MDNENMKSPCGTQIPGRCHEVISQKEKNSHPPSCGTGSTMIVNLDSDDDNMEITTPLSMMVASGIGTSTPTEPADDTGRASQPLKTPTITRNLFHMSTSVGGRAKRPRTAMVAKSGPVLSAQKRKFRVTLAMDFSMEDRKIFEYIFDESLLGWQEIVRVAQTCATQDEMQVFRPGRAIPDKMVELVTLTCMGAEKLNDPAFTWWLPPSFVVSPQNEPFIIGSCFTIKKGTLARTADPVDLMGAKPIDVVAREYGKMWLSSSFLVRDVRTSLNLTLIGDKNERTGYPFQIFVPVKYGLGYWFLVIVSQLRRKVFIADPSPEGISFSQRLEMASIIQWKIADVVEKLTDYPFAYQEMNNMRDFGLRRPVGLRAGTCSPESSGECVMDGNLY
ncbi:hypothetical protein PIB30_071282 [Stylosanthes scabra]|uniref:Ubiquitin-like protease family profile domain-containing protein n=1 Tax=Stylosanthes scabra TaxID=79078 RepID=A0ABU6WM13_9FABA|nr:hypothetical protein [Stylosanthes scabra]